MVDKIKEIIDKNKENKDNFIGYIESFTENDKANELYNTNDEFKELKEFIETKKDNN